MLESAVYHIPYHNYAYPVNKDTLCIKLRAKKGDLEEVSVVYDGRFKNWNLNPPRYATKLKKYSSDQQYDYFKGTIQLESKKFRYYFVLDDGLEQVYYGGQFSSDIPEHNDCFEYSYICERDLFDTPEWVQNAVFYQIYPDSFYNANPEISPAETSPWGQRADRSTVYGGDLQGIIDKLDYIDQLGVDALYLTPIFEAETTHKYDTIDYLSIDDNFGDLEVCKELVEQAHQRDIKVIFDAVFNHCSNQFFAFQDVLEKGADSEYKDWFYINEFPVKEDPGVDYAVLEKLVRELNKLEKLDYQVIKQDVLPKLSINNEVGRQYLDELVKKLLEKYKQSKINVKSLRTLSQQHPELEKMITPNYETFANKTWDMPKLRTANSEVRDYLLQVGEYWIKEVGIDGWRLDVANEVDHKFWREFREVIKDIKEDAYIVGEVWDDGTSWLLGDQFDGVMNYVFTDAVWDFFCRQEINVEAFEDQLCQVRTKYKKPAQLASLNLLDSHDTDRALTVANNDITKYKLAVAFQMTYLGPPMIFYGDEVGLTGEAFTSCRQSMMWEEAEQDRELLEWYQKLIAIRQDNPALRTGDFELVTTDAVKNVYAFKRSKGDNQLLVIFNNSPQQAALEFDRAGLDITKDSVVDLITECEYKIEQEKLTLEIAGYQVLVLA